MTAPLTYEWTDEGVMRPLARFAKLADKQFVVGLTYPMVVAEERSIASHRQYFAALHEYWLNLPEPEAERFPTEEHLRKWCLIKAGFADERSIVCSSKAEALRLAAFIKPMDTYSVVDVREATIRVYTAQSQSMRAMGKKDFQASKQAVLEICEVMVSASVDPRAPSIAPEQPNSRARARA
jgi:hypothetical protein